MGSSSSFHTQAMFLHLKEKEIFQEPPEASRNTELNRHLCSHQRTNTGEKVDKCKERGKSFPRSDVLTLHVRAHRGEKCVVSGKSISQSGHLPNTKDIAQERRSFINA